MSAELSKRMSQPGTVESLRNDAFELMVRALDYYGERSAAAAIDLFDDTMEAEGLAVRGTMPSGLFTRAEIERIARYQAGKLREDDRQGFIDQVAKSVGGLVYQAGNRSVMYQGGLYHQPRQGAKRMRYVTKGVDKTPGAPQVRYARLPQGAETCNFCLMLAARGFVYLTVESAQGWNHTHRGCDCIVVAGVGHYDEEARWEQDTTMEDYDLGLMSQVLDAWIAVDEKYADEEEDAIRQAKLAEMESIMGRSEW